jgi:hypothetical protein
MYFRMSENYPCDVLLIFSLLRVFIFFLRFALDFIIFIYVMYFMYIIIPIS